MWKSKFYGAFVLNHRVVLHAIDATPARWRGDAGSSPLDRARTATSSPRNDLVKNCRVHPTHWLISTQVNKFSKFIHACATLLPDEVQDMPYWIDDPALRDSIKATNSTLLKAEDQVGYTQTEAGRIEAWTNPSQQWARPEPPRPDAPGATQCINQHVAARLRHAARLTG